MQKKTILPIILLFLGQFAFAQQPNLYLDFPDTTCTTILTYEDDSSSLAALGYELNEEWVSIGADTFEGFWLHERFFVPSSGIVLTVMDCGVTFDYVPEFGSLRVQQCAPKIPWINRPSSPASAALFFTSIGTSLLAGYCGGQAEKLRAHNGVRTSNWDAFHTNRDASLWLIGATGVSLTLSCTKDPKFTWWTAPVKIGMCAVGYLVGSQIGYHD